jgi:type I restriction enzyme M protein
MRWEERNAAERERPRTAQSFCVRKADIEAAGYDLSLNHYHEVEHDSIDHDSPAEILADLRKIETEIADGMARLAEMLG